MTNWDQRYCPTCGTGQVPDASFCGNCGTSFAADRASHGHSDPYLSYDDRHGTPYSDSPPEPQAYAPGHSGHYGYDDPYSYPQEDELRRAPYTQDSHGEPTAFAHPLPGRHSDPGGYDSHGEHDHYGEHDSGAAGPPDPAAEGHATAERRHTPLLIATAALLLGVSVGSPYVLAVDADDNEAGQVADVTGGIVLQPADELPAGAYLTGQDVSTGASAELNMDLARDPEAEVPLDEIVHRVVSLPDHDAVAASQDDPLITLSGTSPGAYSGYRREGVCSRSVLVEALTPSSDDHGANEDGDDSDSDDGEGGDSSVELRAGTVEDYLTALDIVPDQVDGDGEDDADEADSDGENGDSEQPDVDEFVDNLTPVRLRFDTLVTQHSVVEDDNGHSVTPTQTVLQAGTGVLVDDTGLPRVSCNGGNPLSPAEPPAVDDSQAIDDLAANPQAAWERLDLRRVAVIEAGEPIDGRMMFADIATTDLIERPVGSNGDRDLSPGDFTATLSWDSPADLDIAVVDPNGALVAAGATNPENSRGRLSGDANTLCEDNMIGEEIISWPDGNAPRGDYTIRVQGHAVGDSPSGDEDVTYVADCGDNEASFTLTVRLYQHDTIVHEGSVTDGETDEITVTLGEGGDDAPDDDAEGDEDEDDSDG